MSNVDVLFWPARAKIFPQGCLYNYNNYNVLLVVEQKCKWEFRFPKKNIKKLKVSKVFSSIGRLSIGKSWNWHCCVSCCRFFKFFAFVVATVICDFSSINDSFSNFHLDWRKKGLNCIFIASKHKGYVHVPD